MTLLFIILSYVILRFIFKDYYKRRKENKSFQPQALEYVKPAMTERQLKAAQAEKKRLEKQQQQKAQAKNDIPFYEIQLERLYITVEDVRNIYKKACDNVNHDNDLNRYGAVVKDKVVNQHIQERDKTLKKLITLENQIHALEKKLAQAETIIARD